MDEKIIELANGPSQGPDFQVCPKCECQFKVKSSLKRHVARKHPECLESIFPSKNNEDMHKCTMCSSQFKDERNLRYHERQKHSLFLKKVDEKCFRYCLLCCENIPSNDILCHYNNTHDIVMETIDLQFHSEQEFFVWKGNLEKETFAYYIKERASKESQISINSTYICHRSGHFKSKSSGKRHIKIKGSNKINGYCPSKIFVSVCKSTSMYYVKYTKTHIGHANELGRAPLKLITQECTTQETNPDLVINVCKNETEEENNLIVEQLSISRENISSFKNKLMKELKDLIDSFETQEEILQFRKIINRIKYKKSQIVDNTLPNKKICPQRYLCSIKKQKTVPAKSKTNLRGK